MQSGTAAETFGKTDVQRWPSCVDPRVNPSFLCSLLRLHASRDRSFADPDVEKILHGGPLTLKEQRALGGLDIDKAQERLAILNQANERDLLMLRSLHYHRLQGSTRHSIDANSRVCKWRITFTWVDEGMAEVELVRIEDTHQ